MTTLRICVALSFILASPLMAIQGGKLSAPGAHPATVALTNADGKIYCTGSLVANDLVISAAHCLLDREADSVRIYVGNGDQGLIFPKAELHRVKRIGVHPEYDGPYNATPTHDIAYVVLAEPFNLSAASLAVAATDYDEIEATLVTNHAVKLVGFGCYDQLVECHGGQKAEVDVGINSFGLNIAYVGDDKKRSLWGDSGGPAIVEAKTGQPRVIAVTSQNAGDRQVAYTLIPPHICWIARDSGVAIAGAEKHCYEDFKAGAPGPFVDRTRAKLRAQSDGRKEINLDRAYVVDLTPLADLRGVETLSIVGNPRAHLESIASVKTLRVLRTDVNQASLPALTKLREALPGLVIRSGNPEADLSAAIAADAGEVFNLAVESLRPLSATDARNVSLFMFAVQKGRVEMARALIKRGANLNATEPEQGHTALIYAVISDNLDMVKLIVESGADTKAKNNWGRNAYELAVQWNNTAIAAYLAKH